MDDQPRGELARKAVNEHDLIARKHTERLFNQSTRLRGEADNRSLARDRAVTDQANVIVKTVADAQHGARRLIPNVLTHGILRQVHVCI